jgi:hypothetical protein
VVLFKTYPPEKRYRKFSEDLITDENFVKEAKELFKKQNIEITNEDLIEILEVAEKSITKNELLPEDELIEITGGLTKQNIEHLGMLVGSHIGFVIGGGLVEWATHRTDRMEDSRENVWKVISGGAVGSVAGACLGFKLGSLVAKKLGY